MTSVYTAQSSAFASLLIAQLFDAIDNSTFTLSLSDAVTHRLLGAVNLTASAGQSLYSGSFPGQFLVAGGLYSLTLVLTSGNVSAAAAAPADLQMAALAYQPATLPVQGSASGSLCLLTYALPGNVDFPWSMATSLTFTYNPPLIRPQAATSPATPVQLLTGAGTRTYTNRFGATFTTPITLATTGATVDVNLLYLNSALPVDGTGITWLPASPLQLPGAGPTHLYGALNVVSTGLAVMEVGGSQVDALGQAYVATVPGFANVTIGPSDINSLAVNYAQCKAPITFVDGVRPPTQPSSFNGAVHFHWGYTVSDGATYSVQVSLAVTASSAFATTSDQLGNPYQTLINVTGNRTYTYLPTGEQLVSQVTGLSAAATPAPSQRFYPYALLSSGPGVYTMDMTPFVDGAGLGLQLDSTVPINGNPPAVGPQSDSVVVQTSPLDSTGSVLTEAAFIALPLGSLQKQTYTLLV